VFGHEAIPIIKLKNKPPKGLKSNKNFIQSVETDACNPIKMTELSKGKKP